jgi:Collagen triple helix repeat (20 copies)
MSNRRKTLALNNEIFQKSITNIENTFRLTGPTGPTGIQGEIGPTGSGATGSQGEAGQNGLTGEIGPTGQNGLTGAIGPTGQNGLTGAIGPTGQNGLMGPPGENGPTGASFSSGIVFLPESSSSLSISLADGRDYFIEPKSEITTFAITSIPDTSQQFYVFKFIFKPIAISTPYYIQAESVQISLVDAIEPVDVMMPLPTITAPETYSTILQTITLYEVNRTYYLTSSLLFYN